MNADCEQMKKQTLMWLVKNCSKDKINVKNMVMVINDGIPSFVPRHLL